MEETVTITNPLGLHARPSAMIARIVGRSKSEAVLILEKEGEKSVDNGKNIMELMHTLLFLL